MAVYMTVRGRSDDVQKAQLGCKAPTEWRKSCANGGGGGHKVEILDYISLEAQLRISHVHTPDIITVARVKRESRPRARSKQPDSLDQKWIPAADGRLRNSEPRLEGQFFAPTSIAHSTGQ